MPTRTIQLPVTTISSTLTPKTGCSVGPTLPQEVAFWRQIMSLKPLLWWLFGIDIQPSIDSNKLSRGYIHHFESAQGACELEVLRWNPFQECVMLINWHSCRVALSISLIYSHEKVLAQLKSEYEVSGWKGFWLPIFRVLLKHRYRKMSTRLEQLLNPAKKRLKP